MAEPWFSKVLCRYYLSGMCRDGTECRFSHDRENSQPVMTCRFYVKGQCAYGDSCRYDHIKPKSSSNINSKTKSRSIPLQLKGTNTIENDDKSLKTIAKINLDSDIKSSILIKQHDNQSLDKDNNDTDSVIPAGATCSDWVEAEEFVPRKTAVSYAHVVNPDKTCESVILPEESEDCGDKVCPYAVVGECWYGEKCAYIHGDVCDMCGKACLHPNDKEQRQHHFEECMKQHERDMELSFAIQRSKDKTCGICMDIIMDKLPLTERRFGILPNCSHVFCLSCIRKWRSARQFDNKIIRSCPECRVQSNFVTPSKYWMDDKEDKMKLIDGYKKVLSSKPCKYFKQGQGECPFAGNCFYLHAYPDGRKVELSPPRARRRRNASGDLDLVQRLLLWDFIEERELHLNYWIDFDDAFDFYADMYDTSSDESSDLDMFD